MKKVLIHFILPCIIILSLSGSAFSAGEFFRSVTSGNWDANSTWEMSTNSGSTWIAATLTPNALSGTISVRNPNTVTVTVSVTSDQLTIDSGGTVSINSGINLNLLNGTGNDITVLKGGTVTGAGTVQTLVTVAMNLRGGSNFNAALKVNSGTATVSDNSSPFIAKLFGPVTVDAGATLNTNTSTSYTLYIYGNTANFGTITGTGSSNTIKFYGSSLVNIGSITSPVFSFDTTTSVAGAGTFTGADIQINGNGNVSLLNNVTFSLSSELIINAGAIFSANTFIFTFTSGEFRIMSGGTVANSGTIRTQNSVNLNPRTGSSFNANLNINTGTTIASELSSPFDAKLYGNVTVDAGATLNSNSSSSYELYIYGSITNNGTITGVGSANTIRLYGPSLINNGSITSPVFRFDSTTTITSSGFFTGADIIVGGTGNVSLLSDVTFSLTSELIINAGGIFSANTRILTFTSGEFRLLSGGSVVNSGTIRTENLVNLNPLSGSSFNANLIIASGTTTAAELASPFDAKLFGNVTVDAGATLNTNNSSSYELYIYGSLTNNGTITGTGSANTIRFYGTTLTNNGSITSPVFRFDTVSTVSGTGSYTGGDIIIFNNGNVSLLNDVTFSLSSEFIIYNGGLFSANTRIFTFTSGTFTIAGGGTVASSGTVRTQNNVYLDPQTGSSFNAILNVNTGTTIASELSSPFNAKLYGIVTVDAGATLNTNNSESYTLYLYSSIANNGSITGIGDLVFQSGSHTLQGTGIISAEVYLQFGATLNLITNHQFASVDITLGATFNIGSNTVKFTAVNPIVQNGTFTNVNSDIEFNGTSSQNIPTANINYYGLRINNPAGTILTNNITIPDTLSIIAGDLNLNGKIITIGSSGYMTETPGNVVFGTTGYITATRNVGAPSSLNVAGMGAVLTSAVNIGVTEVRRGHTVQTGLNGGTSIKRYYDITPTTNTGLNATLVYKFDDSELNGKPEPSLKLFKSTNSGSNWLFQGGNVNIVTNEITLTGLTSFSRWSADSSKVSAAISMIMEGFYNTGTNNLNMSDTVRAYLRNTTTPFAIVDSAVGILDSLTFRSALQFNNATTGTYYIHLKHRNSLETWSKNGINYIQDSTLNYDFTFAATQAYGNNEVLKGTKYCLFSGDVNQDGLVDLSDVILINNASSAFATGYVVTDVNGNSIVDLTDVLIANNNSNAFVKRKTPLNP